MGIIEKCKREKSSYACHVGDNRHCGNGDVRKGTEYV